MTDSGFDFGARVRQAMSAEPSPRRTEMRRLGEAMRQVIERLVGTKAPLEALAVAADELERVAAALAEYPQGRTMEGFAESANSGDPHAFFDHSPIIGRSNPLAPPVELEVRDGKVYGRAVYGSAYEGPPASVHGGYIAAAFDEVLGMTQSMSGNPGMTGTLTVKYRSPTPLHTELRFEGTLERVEGRKIFTSGRLFSGDRLCAEAEAIFISVDFRKFAELMARQGQPPADPEGR